MSGVERGTHLWRASLILERRGTRFIEGKGNRRRALVRPTQREQARETLLTMYKDENRELSTSRGPLRGESPSGITRRRFLSASAKGIGLSALLSGLPTGWAGSVFADDAPETSDLKIGIIALTDCSTIVIAHEKGLFKKHGINSVVSKGASWAAH
jgi:NMT1-like family